MPYNRNIDIIEIIYIYIYENYLHFNIILEINICANSNTTSGQCPSLVAL